jgi:coenzyme Q-binding protein COQ10
MPCIKQNKICVASVESAYELVKNFKDYPNFLPWCSGARLRESSTDNAGQDIFIADLIISYKIFSESFTTKVTCNPTKRHIQIENVKGPFKYLKSYWQFTSVDNAPDKVNIEFMIDFEFKSGIFQTIIGLFFSEAMNRMISAFETELQKQNI